MDDSYPKYLRSSLKFCIIGGEGDITWEPPEATFIKIDCDGSWMPGSRRTGFGCIARDSMGLVIGVRDGFMEEGISSTEPERPLYSSC